MKLRKQEIWYDLYRNKRTKYNIISKIGYFHISHNTEIDCIYDYEHLAKKKFIIFYILEGEQHGNKRRYSVYI